MIHKQSRDDRLSLKYVTVYDRPEDVHNSKSRRCRQAMQRRSAGRNNGEPSMYIIKFVCSAVRSHGVEH